MLADGQFGVGQVGDGSGQAREAEEGTASGHLGREERRTNGSVGFRMGEAEVVEGGEEPG